MAGAPLELLERVELFRGLSPRQLKEIAGSMKDHRYEAGHVIVTEGRGGVGFFVISDGTAKVTIDADDVRTLGPGSSFGEIALISDSDRTATVTAETDLTCWALPSWAFRPMVAANPALASRLQEEMSRLLGDS
jgi:CRP/FNR family transcriptional regulator, cyclic AMP receptor protein